VLRHGLCSLGMVSPGAITTPAWRLTASIVASAYRAHPARWMSTTTAARGNWPACGSDLTARPCAGLIPRKSAFQCAAFAATR
jgi:hypothetical protein